MALSIMIPKKSLLSLLNRYGIEPTHIRFVRHIRDHFYQWIHPALSDRFCVFTGCSQLCGHFIHSLSTAGVDNVAEYLFPNVSPCDARFRTRPKFRGLPANYKAFRTKLGANIPDNDVALLAYFRDLILFVIQCQYHFGCSNDGFGLHSVFEALYGQSHDAVVTSRS